MRRLLESPPQSPVHPVTDIYHGICISDPYRWLEDKDSADTREWLNNQETYLRLYLESVPGRDLVRERIHRLLSVDVIDTPRKVGNRIFFLKREARQEQPVITMREGLDGTDISLLDPTKCFGRSSTSVGIVTVSKDGRLLAFSVRRGGEDFHEIHILDVNTHEILPDRLPRGLSRGFVFSADSAGFFYSHQHFDTQSSFCHAAYWHQFGTDAKNDAKVFSISGDRNVQLAITGSTGGRYLGFVTRRIGATRTHDFFLQDLQSHGDPFLIGERFEGVLSAFLLEKVVVCLVSAPQGNGRIIAADLEKNGPVNWYTVVPESEAKIHEFVVIGETLFVRYVANTECRVHICDLAGRSQGFLPCPPNGTPRFFPSDNSSDVLFYRFSSFTQPHSIHVYDPRTATDRVWTSKQLPFDGTSLETTSAHCNSSDGTRLPIYLIRRRDRRGLGPLPTVLTAYGGFGNSVTPEFSLFGSFLAEKGCLFAIAVIRGGSEFGSQWHSDGKRQKRQNAINDFLATADWLLQSGCTAPGRLGIAGGSNGGLLVAAAMTQRPDRFRAVLCLGPLLDMLRYHRFDAAHKWIEEYGCADDPQDFAALQAYSPYHAIRDGTSYPATMLVSGDSDTRCNPMHSRKMVARLQAANTSEHPIILDYRPSWGHMPVQPLQTRIQVLTDRLSFLCWELGVEI